MAPNYFDYQAAILYYD